MISIRIDASQPLARMKAKLEAVQNKEKMLRTVAVGLLPVVKTRIHEQGLDATEQPIGTYSPAYMKVRTGQFKNARHKEILHAKGFSDAAINRNTNSGFFTKGKNAVFSIKKRKAVKTKASMRPRYNRTSDTKKVVSLTRQLENDFSVLPSGKGYGLGYKNIENLNKMRHQEEQENKKIAKLTPKERGTAVLIAKEYLSGISG